MRLLLIDGLNLIRRIYAAVPGDQGTAAHDDDVSRSCSRSLERALDALQPTHGAIVFESGSNTWRHQLHPAYKAGRRPMPDGLKALLPRLEAEFAQRGIRAVRVTDFEADDVIASAAMSLRDHLEVLILSSDKGFLPLLAHGIRVRNHFEERELDEAYVTERFGVGPVQLPTYLALVGDTSQGIPGVRGIGRKMAAKLTASYGTLEALYAASATMTGRAATALACSEPDARLSLTLTGLKTDVAIGLKLSELRIQTS